MATFINPNIIVRNAMKRQVGFTIIFDEKEPDSLLIKAKNSKGHGLGTAGRILRNGDVSIKKWHKSVLTPLIYNDGMKKRLDVVLDLIYGKNRMNRCIAKKVQDVNIIEFKK